jgi:hypothetical protein
VGSTVRAFYNYIFTTKVFTPFGTLLAPVTKQNSHMNLFPFWEAISAWFPTFSTFSHIEVSTGWINTLLDGEKAFKNFQTSLQ